jgi:FMN phosphatase YigB (HAD superfamily)
MTVFFFDIGATLADVSVEADGSLRFQVRPRVPDVLHDLSGARKGILSDPGPGEEARARAAAALDAALGDHFTDTRLLHWGPKTSRALFDEAVASAGGAAGDEVGVFVGEDADERAFARQAGLRTAAHPVFARAAAEDRPVFWTWLGVPEGRSLADLAEAVDGTEAVPVHVPSPGLVLAMATSLGVEDLRRGGFTADVREQVEDTAAFLVRDDRPVSVPESFAGASDASRAAAEASARAAAAYGFLTGGLPGDAPPPVSLGAAPGGVYIAAPAGVPVEDLHPPGAKPGHVERLLPDPALLSRPGVAQARDLAEGPAEGFADGRPSPRVMAAVSAAVTPDALRAHVARISGASPLVDGEELRVRSRDAAGDDNQRVVDALADRFRDLGLAVRRHEFTWRGHRLSNVEAEHRVEGADSTVLVTAHLDSTASSGDFTDENGEPRPYDPAADPAPGADDDGSGTAAVLAAAESLRALVADGGTPTRNVRFVLFNAEEQGLVGSKFYARAAAARGEAIVGVFQMDMIAGLQDGSAPRMEIHAGSRVPGPVVHASDALGGLVAHTTEAIAPEFTVQQLTGPDDPAVGRSDHASFHERGWAAVAVSEDLFSTPDGAPGTGTRQYHTPGDTLSDVDHDAEFAATIARCVTATALTVAGL